MLATALHILNLATPVGARSHRDWQQSHYQIAKLSPCYLSQENKILLNLRSADVICINKFLWLTSIYFLTSLVLESDSEVQNKLDFGVELPWWYPGEQRKQICGHNRLIQGANRVHLHISVSLYISQ